MTCATTVKEVIDLAKEKISDKWERAQQEKRELEQLRQTLNADFQRHTDSLPDLNSGKSPKWRLRNNASQAVNDYTRRGVEPRTPYYEWDPSVRDVSKGLKKLNKKRK